MELIIDRFVDDFAICENEDKAYINIRIDDLPENARVGDIILINNEGIIIKKEDTSKRKEYIEEITKDIWE